MERIDDKNIQYYYLKDDGIFPNNAKLPVLFYKGMIPRKFFKDSGGIENLLKQHQWENVWTNGIYDEHHYHSTAHEVLIAIEGNIRLELGGENGVVLHFDAGDAVVIPAGVGHKNLDPDKDFKCLGAYPKGQKYDMNYGKADEREKADRNIEKLPLPAADPLFGSEGPLMKYWVAIQQASGQASI